MCLFHTISHSRYVYYYLEIETLFHHNSPITRHHALHNHQNEERKRKNVTLNYPKNRSPPCPNPNNTTPKLLRKPPLASSLHRRGHLSNNEQGAANPASKLQGEHLSPGRRPQGNSEIPRLANRPDGFGCAWHLGWCAGA